VRTSDGQVGWVAAEFLQAITYRLTDAEVRMRAQPNASADILVQDLGMGAIATQVSQRVVNADGHDWRNVRTADGQVGWVAAEFLEALGSQSDDELTDEPDHAFSFATLWPYIQTAAGKWSADPQIIAAIMQQESSFTNWRVHRDHTGHGLFGLDDNGLLPDFEEFSGLSVGRGDDAVSIPPKPQIEYTCRTIAAYTLSFGSAINAARVWHHGPGLWQDALGQEYED
jgi:SH3-like domain-containing protein